MAQLLLKAGAAHRGPALNLPATPVTDRERSLISLPILGGPGLLCLKRRGVDPGAVAR